MTAYDEERMKAALRDQCRQEKGCLEIGPKECSWCGFNRAEEDKRLRRGLVLDSATGLRHFVPSKRPAPPSIQGVKAGE